MDLDPQMVALGVRLAESAARNTATSISTRVNAAKAARRDKEAVVELEEIITELSQDRNELLQIAQAFKEQVVGQTISEADVEYITRQLVPKIKQIVDMVPDGSDLDTQAAHSMIDVLSPILSYETLTILQLLGFNFKRAIGEPLTDLVAQLIASRRGADPTAIAEVQRIVVERDIALAALAQDEAAFERFRSGFGGSS